MALSKTNDDKVSVGPFQSSTPVSGKVSQVAQEVSGTSLQSELLA